jgi:hypothetical protein
MCVFLFQSVSLSFPLFQSVSLSFPLNSQDPTLSIFVRPDTETLVDGVRTAAAPKNKTAEEADMEEAIQLSLAESLSLAEVSEADLKMSLTESKAATDVYHDGRVPVLQTAGAALRASEQAKTDRGTQMSRQQALAKLKLPPTGKCVVAWTSRV